MPIEAADSFSVGKENTPLDSRTRVASESDIRNIELPFVGMLVYCEDSKKTFVVHSLDEVLINNKFPKKIVGEYAEFGGEGGGTPVSYTFADGLKVNGNVISVDFDVIAKIKDLPQQNLNYNILQNKPEFIAGSNVIINTVAAGTLHVSGAGNEETNGDYVPLDNSAVGTARMWQKEGRIIYHDGVKWCIDNDQDNTGVYYYAISTDDPWTLEFTAALAELGDAPDVTLISFNDIITISAKIPEGSGSGGEGIIYQQGDGILISEKNVISVDFETVAKKDDIIQYAAGAGIEINDNVITCTLEIKEYSGSENISISEDGVIAIGEDVALKSDIPEQKFDYNLLHNKPEIRSGNGVTAKTIQAGTLHVSGAGNEETNGDYVPDDYFASGTARIWHKEGRIIYYDGEKWVIDSDTDNSNFYYSASGDVDADPWTLEFTAALAELGEPPVIAMCDNVMQQIVTVSIEAGSGIEISDNKIAIKGVPFYEELPENFSGLYINAEGLKMAVSGFVTQDVFDQTVGDINSILDKINGEEV